MRPSALLLTLLLLLGTPSVLLQVASAQEEEEAKGALERLDRALESALDPAARPADREAALARVLAAARLAGPARATALSKALPGLFDDLLKRKDDARYGRALVFAFDALDLFAPHPEAGTFVAPCLREAQPLVVQRALRSIRPHRLTGTAKALTALLEPRATAGARAIVDAAVIDAASSLGAGERAAVLEVALERGTTRSVRALAAEALGRTVLTSAPRDALPATSLDALRRAARSDDDVVACAAALALVRHGSLDGVGELVASLVRGGSREVYRAVCASAFEEQGFASVSPARFLEVEPEARARAIEAARAWWEEVRTRGADVALLSALARRGVKVPPDPRSKEAIASLIDGLDVPGLRRASLDLLVRRTGRADLASRFFLLKTPLGRAGTTTLEEPEDGFASDSDREALAAQQRVRAAEWREWWEKAAPRARLRDGVWIVDEAR